MRKFKIEILIDEQDNGDTLVSYKTWKEPTRNIKVSLSCRTFSETSAKIQDFLLGEIARLPYEDILRRIDTVRGGIQ